MNKDFQTNLTRGRAQGARTDVHAPMRVLNILIACEESQAECIACRDLGHNAYSCDIQPCRKGGHPEWHIKGDVTPYLQGKTQFKTMDGMLHILSRWDLIIAHPPCTYLSKVGIHHLFKNPDFHISRDGEMLEVNYDRVMKMKMAREFFMKCINAEAYYVAVENPIPMRLAKLPPPSDYACPSWFGVKYTKKTLYWLKNLPPIMAEYIHNNPRCYATSSRGKYRSRTFPSMAKEVCRQWIEFILNDTA